MIEEKIIDAIGNIDENLIEETDRLRNRKRPFNYAIPAAVAACILLTVLLIPWKTLLSNNAPSSNDPISSDTGINILKNDDTTCPATTNEYPLSVPDDSTQSNTKELSNDDYQISPQGPDTKVPNTSNSNVTEITDPYSSDTQAPETASPYPEKGQGNDNADIDTTFDPNYKDIDPYPKDTTETKEETTGPVVPEEPPISDPVIPLPQVPTILSLPLYPKQTQYSLPSLREWRLEKDERINHYRHGIGDMDSFISLTAYEFFANSENENIIYSPTNTYMSLGMLAETTAGNSRTQLLSLLGNDDIYGIRSSAMNLWNCTYRDDGIVTTILGNSMWFDDSFIPRTATTDILAENYYASSFWGNMGDSEYDALMRSWVNEQTKRLLKNNVSNTSLDPESMITVMSTLYFKADWSTPFDKNYTGNMTFKTPTGDIKTQTMYKEESGFLYLGENFKATSLKFKEGGAMWFILPDEDVNLQSLFSDSEAMDFITGKAQANSSTFDTARIRLYLPKFDITAELDLKENLKNLGVTDVFDPYTSDFSTLTDTPYVYIKDINTAVRVRIDEYGCEAAAVNMWSGGTGAAQTVTFRLNRPFIFIITSDAGLPLFVGTVNYPN